MTESRATRRPTGRNDGGSEGDNTPARTLLDPRVLQILTAEHSSLSAARSLAYNEAFTRGGMFLTFLSMSFVGLALVAQALPFDRDFLLVTALVLAFDVVVGITTYGRIVAANSEDYRAVHGMARIRHTYGEIAPVALRLFTTSVHDDLPGVMVSYGSPPDRLPGAIVYGLTTSAGMIALIVSLVSGVLGLVATLILGAPAAPAFAVAVIVGLLVLAFLIGLAVRYYAGVQATLTVLFPTPDDASAQPSSGSPSPSRG